MHKGIQSDNESEFKKNIKQFCKINMMKSRPYNPKCQAKVERFHRVVRKKFTMIW